MKENYFYICDRKREACTNKYKSVRCINGMCLHTSDITHAKYKNEAARKFSICTYSDEIFYMEIIGTCSHPKIFCRWQTTTSGSGDIKLCTEKECPHWRLRE